MIIYADQIRSREKTEARKVFLKMQTRFIKANKMMTTNNQIGLEYRQKYGKIIQCPMRLMTREGLMI